MENNSVDKNTKAVKTNNRIGYAKLLIQGTMLSLVIWQSYTFFSNEDESKNEDHIAVIKLSGAIQDGSRYGDGISFAETIDKILANKNAKAILIEANSPGGSPTQAEIINSVLRLATENKDVIVNIGEICASACLFALAGNPNIEITAHRASMVGSVGVKIEAFGFSELLERFSVERRSYSVGKFKTFLDPFSKTDPLIVSHIENELLAPVFEQFKEILIEGRGDKITDDRVFSGLMWTGQNAVKIGLVDELITNYDLRNTMKVKYNVDNFVYYNEQNRSIVDIFSASVTTLLESQASFQFKQ